MASDAAAEMAKAEFIADVEKYMDGRQPEEAILELQERLRRYKLLEQQLLAKRERLAATPARPSRSAPISS